MPMNDTPLDAARLVLEGLSIGDAFGERFFMPPDIALRLIQSRTLPREPWLFTDDTNMALSIFETLSKYGEVDQNKIAASFAQHYDPKRGYGPAMHRLLRRIAAGEDWQAVASNLFSSQGSYGNGAAMRVAPIGAYFAEDLEKVAEQAQKTAVVTHTHPEGIAGAIAVATATAHAVRLNGQPVPTRVEFLDMVLPFVPDGEVQSGIKRARDIRTSDVAHVASVVGNGSQITAQDTVPFALWCAGESLDRFENALWLTASVSGDIDTNCAIVGGIVSGYVGYDGIPQEWIQKREPLPAWAFS